MAHDDLPAVVRNAADVRALPVTTSELQVVGVLDDAMAMALARLPRLRVLRQAGSSHITDAGIRALASLRELEELDLEWSDAITDAALEVLSTLPRLRHVDLDFCQGLTAAGVARLQHACPTLTIESPLA